MARGNKLLKVLKDSKHLKHLKFPRPYYKNPLSTPERGRKGVRFRYKKTPPKRGLKNQASFNSYFVE